MGLGIGNVSKVYFGLIMLFLYSCVCKESNSSIMPVDSFQSVNYELSDDLFPNPERGFYKQYTAYGNTPCLTLDELKHLHGMNISLILRLYYLKDYRDKELSNEMLNFIQEDMNIIRTSGVKVILRFAYSENLEEPDAPLAIVLKHLEQLRPILEKNYDIITVLQAGFIGSWGEWGYSTNGLRSPENRRKILDKILEVLPKDRCVQVRTPLYKKEYINLSLPIVESQAYKEIPIARIGHHNDCFMASPDDYGTYTDVVKDKEYLSWEGLYLPMGGETCPPLGIPPVDCEKAQVEMRKLRWSYLNDDYYRGVLDNWELQGCMDDIVRNLGYRIVLQKGRFSKRCYPGGDLIVNLSLANEGYASFYNKRNVELILKSDEKIYTTLLPDDPRYWKPGTDVEIKAHVALPKNISLGKYKLFLFLPDSQERLHDRAEYAVQCANKGCWDFKTGYNDLNVEVLIEEREPNDMLSNSKQRFLLNN